MKIFKLLIVSLFLLINFAGCAQQKNDDVLTVKELKAKLESDDNFVLLDVRTPEELAGPLGKIEGAINIPVQQLKSRLNELEKYKDDEIVVICRTQNRSAAAADILNANGYNAKHVAGGMMEFRK